jgi:hypothetical protein
LTVRDFEHGAIGYSLDRAVVVVEVATLAIFVTGRITMIIIGVLLNVIGLRANSVAGSPIVRLVIGLLFAVPASYAGYDLTFVLARFSIPQEWWRRHRRRVHRLRTCRS